MSQHRGRPPYPELHRKLIDAGWAMRITGTSHYLYTPPRGVVTKPVVIPGSPGRGRAENNAKADVRRALREQANQCPSV
jgi:hypothetical protein